MGCSIKNKKVEKVDEECFFNNEVIFARESEKNKYDCESNNKCRWKGLGGEKERAYACCPIGLKQTPESMDKYSTCFMTVD